MDTKNFRATLVVMLSLGLAMATGFLRQSALASTLGAGRVTDIFLIAFAIPEFVFVALPVILSPVVIPLFNQVRRRADETSAWQVTRRLGGWVFAVLSALALLAALTAPAWITWLSPGFSGAERSQAASVFYWMLPGILFMGVSTLVGALLQVYRRFARPALTTAIYNLIFILCLLFLPLADPLQRAGLGVSLGAVAALLFQLPLAWRVRREVSPTILGANSELVGLQPALRLLVWMAAGYGIHHLILFVDRAMATSQGTGSAAVLNFGYHLALTVGQLSGLAVSTVLFPTLSEQIETENATAARRTLSQAMGLVLVLALPAALGVIALRQPVVQALLEYGAFTAQDTQAVATSLAIYTLAVLADALCQPLWRLVYAWKGGRQVLAVNGVQTIIRLAANLLLVGVIGYNGLAVSAVIGLSAQLLILMAVAHRRLDWRISRSEWGWIAWIATGAGLAALAAVGVGQALARTPAGATPWLVLLVGGFGLLLVYGAFLAVRYRRPLQNKEGIFHWKR